MSGKENEVPKDGASIKNYYIKKRLLELGYSLTIVDTKNWRKNIRVFLRLLGVVLFKRKSLFIISTSYFSAYRLLKFLPYFISPQNIIYWAIGGAIAEKIEANHLTPEVYKKIRMMIVEGNSIKDNLARFGITNVEVLPNFKEISTLPIIKQKDGEVFRFVFLSRIIPEKGCNLIIEACKKLNSASYEKKYNVTFYGPIEEGYKESFLGKIEDVPNIKYEGFLDLRNPNNYSILVKYDAFLFPTFWSTEGFPGIIIDAFISGLPVIASDWNLNSDIILPKENGILIEPKNIDALVEGMKYFIHLRAEEIATYRRKSQANALNYSSELVLSPDTLKRIGF